MTLAAGHSARPALARPPAWPKLILGLCALFAVASLAQGVVDVVIPVATGAPLFGVLFALTETYGPAFFIAYVFVHNFGLACLVPGIGFVAARYEKRTANRGLIGLLLAGAVVAALLVAAHFILQSPEDFDLPLALALFAGETVAVLLLAIPAARELRGFVPTPRYEWSLVHPFTRLRAPLVASAILLVALSVWEGHAVLGFGWL